MWYPPETCLTALSLREIANANSRRFFLELSSPQTDCKLRAELKRHYHGLREAIFGQDMKYYWRSEGYMLKLVDKKPEIAMDRGLKQLCNKSTMLYWART